MPNIGTCGLLAAMSNLTPVTTTVVARRLGLSRREVARLVERGALQPATKLPGKTGAYLFDAEQVDALAAERAR